MRISDILSFAGNSIRTRKFRTALTVLGILIGISAIVAFLSLGQGFESRVVSEMDRTFSTRALYVIPKDNGANSVVFYQNQTEKLEAIDHVEIVVPISIRSVTTTFQNDSFSHSLVGTNLTKYSQTFGNFQLDQGSLPEGMEEGVVIGSQVHKPYKNDSIMVNVAENLNMSYYDIGDFEIITKNLTRPVVGVVKPVGTTFIAGFAGDKEIFMSISAYSRIFNTTRCEYFVIKMDSDTNATITNVTAAILKMYDNKVEILSSQAILESVRSQTTMIKVFMGAISGISLIVAGVGILNIMIVSMIERTREIGILKAIGTKDRTILAFFLIECCFIGLIGSLLGIGFGWGLAEYFGTTFGALMIGTTENAAAARIIPVMDLALVLQALIFGTGISVLFGLYPAMRAAKLKPVDALRYE